MDITLDLKNYKEGAVFKRTAARAIIEREGKYLLIHSKYGDYKFPGGGVEKGEAIPDAMIREVQEETGFLVIKDTVQYYGKVLERRKGQFEDVLEMDSHYFICEAYEYLGEQKLDDYEIEYGYKVIWLPIAEAIKRNKMICNNEPCSWVIRDTKVMETLEIRR